MSMMSGGAVYIPSLDAKDLYMSMHYLHGDVRTGYNIRTPRGDMRFSRFINTLDYSLDLLKLREVYESVYRNSRFSTQVDGKEYSHRVINVTFKYALKEYNRIRNGLYIKNGWRPSEIDLEDGVDIRGGELIAVQVGTSVHNAVELSDICPYFYTEGNTYRAKTNIRNVMSIFELRQELYENGFWCDGIHYVRFKRSSGSSRVGKCLFIDEKLYKKMDRWAQCGIVVKDGQQIDLAAWEAYIALTSSSIIDTVDIYPENILLVDDYESVFQDDVIATRIGQGNRLVSEKECVEISNSIWDGQSLLDESLFPAEYSGKGMLLLRNRFFKSACFNTNIQKFFADHGIVDVAQLNGKTRARSISDIRMITTPSSIKYLKFGTFEKWLAELEPTFGIVKYEKPTHFFDGQMVQTHYQLLNTLQMTYKEMEEFLKPSIEYVKLLNSDPAVLRNHIGYPGNDEWYFSNAPLTSKNDIVYKLLGLNERFCDTKLYADFRYDLVKAFVKGMKNGHVLVDGNYSTLLGNPIEMLYHSIGRWDGQSIIGVGQVHSKRFVDGAQLLGSRSPHIAAGNILLTRNVRNALVDKYFNLTNEIVAVNAIGENLLQKLNGADYDSDTMLLTDNEILIRVAKRNYGKFLVPTNLVESKKSKRFYTARQKSDLDFKTSENLIGEIVNLSQELNTLIWDMLNNGAAMDDVYPIYCDVAKLDVMSGLEIDKAKKEFSIRNSEELRILKNKYNRRDKNGRLVKPYFFAHITKQKGYYDPKKKYYLRHNTSMDYLQTILNKAIKVPTSRAVQCLPLCEILDKGPYHVSHVRYYQVNRTIELIRKMKANIRKAWSEYRNATDLRYSCDVKNASEKNGAYDVVSRKIDMEFTSCVSAISGIRFNYSTMYYLVHMIEEDVCKDLRRNLFSILFATSHMSFYKTIRKSSHPVPVLRPAQNDEFDVEIFGKKYLKWY